MKLPVIVGFGGVNAAGRASGHRAYQRLVIDALSTEKQHQVFDSLAVMMADEGEKPSQQYILDNTLIRKISDELFDTENISWNQRLKLLGEQTEFILAKRQLPEQLPASWSVSEVDDKNVKVLVQGEWDCLQPTMRASTVRSAGQMPKGFDPAKLYQARSHPRGLAMSVFGASDAINSMGISWQEILNHVAPDKVSVYAGSAMSQLDPFGNGGMMMSRMTGKKVTSKHCPFGFSEMPADFINAYVLGSVGNTGTNMGACASFLYNLRQGLMDIQSGRARVVVVGNAEAPIVPEVMDGYAAMGALATDAELLALDEGKGLSEADYRRACRPFSSNCGFTIAESAQFIVLMDDELALQLGANIYGAVADVFVNADGNKKSISAPGAGNYLTVAKAAALAKAIVGEQGLRDRSFIQAHGTSTPQNRVTESHILNETAKVFGIENWPVAAVKSYLGHSIGTAAGDQITATLGAFAFGLIPGINTIDHVADDVFADRLLISPEHKEQSLDVALINAKGFGGNNATATLLAPSIVETMLEKRHGKNVMSQWRDNNQKVKEASAAYDEAACLKVPEPIYNFDYNVIDGKDLMFDAHKIKLPGFENSVSLDIANPFDDMV